MLMLWRIFYKLHCLLEPVQAAIAETLNGFWMNEDGNDNWFCKMIKFVLYLVIYQTLFSHIIQMHSWATTATVVIRAQGSVERHRGERGLLLLPRLGQHGRGHPRRVVRDDPVDGGAVDGVNILFLGVAYQVVKPMKKFIFSLHLFYFFGYFMIGFIINEPTWSPKESHLVDTTIWLESCFLYFQ